MESRDFLKILLIIVIILLSRVFFLSEGYGVEEDSWGLVINSFEMSSFKEYVMSRIPGHPVQEIILAALYNLDHSPITYNGLSTLFCILSSVYFLLILRELKFRFSLLATIAMSFTPSIYIASTYTIDYVWALAFILMSYYYLLRNKFILSGILLGLAVGCRITSGALFIPYIITIWLYNDKPRIKSSLTFFLWSIVTVILIYLPAYFKYGIGFINYYELPYPPIIKAIYKGSIGVIGLTASIVLFIIIILFIWRQRLIPYKNAYKADISGLYFPWLLTIILYLIAYWKYPQKSAFLIPSIPFGILILGYWLKPSYFKIISISLIISAFFPSIDITDEYRGADYSDIALKFTVAGQESFIDPLNGPIFSDRSKRIKKKEFTRVFIKKYKQVKVKTVIICGWWYNQIKVNLLEDIINSKVKLVSFADEELLKYFINNGYVIEYLPEQSKANDMKYFTKFTLIYAKPFDIQEEY